MSKNKQMVTMIGDSASGRNKFLRLKKYWSWHRY